VCARPPSLSCRTSPPQRGRLAVPLGFANLQRGRIGEAEKLLISPLEGEMSGRTERGAKDRGLGLHTAAP
ncbi:precorrin-3B synthase, partial [Mesorhizobium sp. B2-7-1]